MRKITARSTAIALAVTAVAITGTAYAEQDARAKHGAGDMTVLSRADAQTRATAMFARMDANKDGKLDQADRETRRQARFDRIDTDKNGQLSRAEFFAPRQAGAHGDRAEGKGWSGRGAGHHRGWGRHGGGRGHLGAMADANKDGAISQAEFTAAALQRFDRADADKNGQVTPEERRAAREAMRQQMRERRQSTTPTAAPATGN